MMGKLKVKGNILLLQRLYSLWLELQKMGKTPELPFITDLMSKTVSNGFVQIDNLPIYFFPNRILNLDYEAK